MDKTWVCVNKDGEEEELPYDESQDLNGDTNEHILDHSGYTSREDMDNNRTIPKEKDPENKIDTHRQENTEETESDAAKDEMDTHRQENKEEIESGATKDEMDMHRQENKEEIESDATKDEMDMHRQENKEEIESDATKDEMDMHRQENKEEIESDATKDEMDTHRQENKEETESGISKDTHRQENKEETESGISKDTHRQENKEETESDATKDEMNTHRQENKEETQLDATKDEMNTHRQENKEETESGVSKDTHRQENKEETESGVSKDTHRQENKEETESGVSKDTHRQENKEETESGVSKDTHRQENKEETESGVSKDTHRQENKEETESGVSKDTHRQENKEETESGVSKDTHRQENKEETESGVSKDTHRQENKEETESGVSKDTHRQENKEETESNATKDESDTHKQEDKEKTVSDPSDKAQTVKIEIPKSIEDGMKVIEKAKSALEESKKREAFDLYKKGIQLLLQGLKVRSLTVEQNADFRHKCSEYLTIAERLQKEIKEENRTLDKKEENTEPTSPLDEEVEKYVNALIQTEKPTITLKDICGCEDAITTLKECIIIPMKFPMLFTGRRIRSPWRGILLYGAPGTGKTLLMRALAGEYPELTYIRIAASDLISNYMGEPEKIVKNCFKKARELRPCIMLIDNIEDLLSEDDFRRVKTEILVQMQGVGLENEGLHVILTTNEPWMISRSIRRRIIRHLFRKLQKQNEKIVLFLDDLEVLCVDEYSCSERIRRVRTELSCQVDHADNVIMVTGTNQPWTIHNFLLKRLSKRIVIPMPDKETRKHIFKKNLESIKHDLSDEDFELLAEKSEGFTGSDIVVVVRDASMEPVREIQAATHFRKIEQESPDDPDDEKNYLYTVCSPDHPFALPMTFQDFMLEPDKLSVRQLNKVDMMKCLTKSKPSMDEEYLQKLHDFTKTYVE